MLFVHSFTPTEQQLNRRLSAFETTTQWDARLNRNRSEFIRLGSFRKQKVLLYSFQQMEYYQQLDSFKRETNFTALLAEFVCLHEFEHLIILSYPGSYYNSQNMFLQHKGIIEQQFIDTGIPLTILNIQGIGDRLSRINNLHALFYQAGDNSYMIPQRKTASIYSVDLNNLMHAILSVIEKKVTGKFDLFDTVSDLSTFLMAYSGVASVQRIQPLYLYVKSFLGHYASATMLELFLQTMTPMFKFRTEKELGIQLEEYNLTELCARIPDRDFAPNIGVQLT